MRNTIQIVGLSDRMKGISKKTGKEYDFQTVSFLYPDKYTTGMKAATCILNGSELDAVGGLVVGMEYDAVFHTGEKNSCFIDAILC